MKKVVKELKQIRKILMNKNYEYTDGECIDEALEYIKQRLLQGEIMTHDELIRKYQLYCKGEYPEYKKEHNTWVVID